MIWQVYCSVALGAPQGPLDSSTLRALEDEVSAAKVIGLGEHIHASGGLADARAQITTHLIETAGVRVVGLETPWLEAEPMERFVQTCDGQIETEMDSLFYVFRDVAIAELATFMCRWNLRHPGDRVSLMGFDVQDPDAAAAHLERTHPELNAGSCPSTFWRAKLGDRRDARVCIERLQYTQLSDLQSELALATLLFWDRSVAVGFRTEAARDMRDVAMAELLLRRLEAEFPDQRAIIWAHNAHLAKTPGNDIATPMGAALHDALLEDYTAVALTSAQTGINWWKGIKPPEATEIDEYLAGSQGAALDILEADWWQEPRMLGDSLGSVAAQFDAVLALTASRPMVPLPSHHPVSGETHCAPGVGYAWSPGEWEDVLVRTIHLVTDAAVTTEPGASRKGRPCSVIRVEATP